MKFVQYLVLLGLSFIVACGNPSSTVTLTSSDLQPALGSSVTLTTTTSLVGTNQSLELLEGERVIRSVSGSGTLEHRVLMNAGGKRSFTARVSNSGGVVASSAVVEVNLKLVEQVALGREHSCVLLSNGDVRCWGGNSVGQLGLGNRISRGDNESISNAGSIQFPVGFKVKQMTAGAGHNCALSEDGKVICWGSNSSGQLGQDDGKFLGDDETLVGVSPIRFPADFKVKQIAAGAFHTCALSETEKVMCWGNNFFGQLGLGNNIDTNAPSIAVDIAPVKTIAVGSGASHTCAILISGGVKCWGSNFSGELGLGFKGDFTEDEDFNEILEDSAAIGDQPGEINQFPPLNFGTSPVKQVAVGESHACALLEDTKLHCWGENRSGQLGYGNTEDFADEPGENPISKNVEINEITQISLGSEHTCAVTQANQVHCWGGTGVLGYGNREAIGDDELPSSVGVVEINTDATQGKIIQVFSGGAHNCVLFESTNIKCWGSNIEGRLGYGNTNPIGDTELPSSVGIVPVF
jgi:alpha-tubulin suppressor-like RCC1 family protein